jgi:hypothetical protein
MSEELSSQEDSMFLVRLTDVDISKVADLTAACSGREPYTGEGPRIWHFVDLKSIQFDKGGGVAQIDLRINDEYERISIEAPPFKPREDKAQVTREQLDVLFDLLEIFPRTPAEPPATEEKFRFISAELSNIAKSADQIRETAEEIEAVSLNASRVHQYPDPTAQGERLNRIEFFAREVLELCKNHRKYIKK